MLVRRTTIITTAAAWLLCLPAVATAAIDVTLDPATGALRVNGSSAVETVTIGRGDGGPLRILDASGAVTSSDGSCTVGADGAASCTTTSGQAVYVSLGAGADRLDARTATGVAISVDAGGGADRLALGASGMATATGSDALDTFDLTHADGQVRARFETTPRRVVVRCGECSTPWAVTLPVAPAAVLLGAQDDVIELARWRTPGRTTWSLGAGKDEFWASPVRRSTVDGGAGADELISRTAVDILRGGIGSDHMADFGGSGDVLQGGADIDLMASMDGKPDTMDGGASSRDWCLGTRQAISSCDTSGRVRSIETSNYLPTMNQATILLMLGIFRS